MAKLYKNLFLAVVVFLVAALMHVLRVQQVQPSLLLSLLLLYVAGIVSGVVAGIANGKIA